ncbi:MAG: hypothetical protein IGR92_03920 [Leptolyngbyaceae cyanobacterium T60_A2020_046]|nr:hypothetical protein [Leptolyngbyaceae cyanobacterium T60_A2020_046]
MLTFETPFARQLADALMQPALIRVVDNIRKQLEASDWRGEYQETQLWPQGIEETQLHRIKALQAQLTEANPEDAAPLRAELAELPQSFPGYELHLTRGDQERVVDVWELCCCVCFQQFPVDGAVAIDMTLIDESIGDINWIVLDEKAKALVDGVFRQLTE